ncbi:MAG: (deoxy)nucleoside triphosphate pyrophosphohydrolase [Rhodobacteraceae bacterium]|nr:(deoxy)nucleoside triphosphate pyrophosphohydrolase [Paracoccaceae bacterium]
MRIILVAAAALIDKDSRVLLAERPVHKALGGLWEYPGGKIEAGETPEAALLRELEEELSISTWGSCLAPLTFASHSYPDFHLLMPVFACRKWIGVPQPNAHSQLKWVRPREIAKYAMPPADRHIGPILRDWLG